MHIETITFDPNGSLTLLNEALSTHGCTIVLGPESPTGIKKVSVHFPEDEYQEKRCRQNIAEWRGENAVTTK